MKATGNFNALDEQSAKLQTALRAEVGLADKVQQLETDKASLDERVAQLAGEGVKQEVLRSELEEVRSETCRLRQAVEVHEAAARQVLITFRPVPKIIFCRL